MLKKYSILIGIILLVFSFSGCDYFGPGTADFSYDLNSSYHLYHAGDTYICKDGDEVIKPNISGIAWDTNFILVKQEDDNKTNYWIIDEDEIYGPLNEEDFDAKRNELRVDDKLKLEDPKKYKKLDKHVK